MWHLIYLLPGAFLAPVIHEFVKARVSASFGDPLPGKTGFLTLNPFKYAEPIGFFLMMFFQVGWGQPVPTSPLYYRDRRKGIILTYTTPIVANLLIGMVTLLVLRILSGSLLEWAGGYGFEARSLLNWSFITMVGLPWEAGIIRAYASDVPLQVRIVFGVIRAVVMFGMLNIRLAIFNLLPVFPLAMSKLLHLFVSPETSMRFTHYEKPIQMILILFLAFNVIEGIISPISNFIAGIIF